MGSERKRDSESTRMSEREEQVRALIAAFDEFTPYIKVGPHHIPFNNLRIAVDKVREALLSPAQPARDELDYSNVVATMPDGEPIFGYKAGEAQPVADAPSEWRKTRGYCLTCNLWMQFADQMEDCKSKGHDLRIPPWPATSPAPRDAESLREEIRDAIITDQATSAADYGEAEAYAERIVGPRESTRGGDWRAVDEHGTKRNPERERGNIPAGSSDSGTQDGQTADGLRPTK